MHRALKNRRINKDLMNGNIDEVETWISELKEQMGKKKKDSTNKHQEESDTINLRANRVEWLMGHKEVKRKIEDEEFKPYEEEATEEDATNSRTEWLMGHKGVKRKIEDEEFKPYEEETTEKGTEKTKIVKIESKPYEEERTEEDTTNVRSVENESKPYEAEATKEDTHENQEKRRSKQEVYESTQSRIADWFSDFNKETIKKEDEGLIDGIIIDGNTTMICKKRKDKTHMECEEGQDRETMGNGESPRNVKIYGKFEKSEELKRSDNFEEPCDLEKPGHKMTKDTSYATVEKVAIKEKDSQYHNKSTRSEGTEEDDFPDLGDLRDEIQTLSNTEVIYTHGGISENSTLRAIATHPILSVATSPPENKMAFKNAIAPSNPYLYYTEKNGEIFTLSDSEFESEDETVNIPDTDWESGEIVNLPDTDLERDETVNIPDTDWESDEIVNIPDTDLESDEIVNISDTGLEDEAGIIDLPDLDTDLEIKIKNEKTRIMAELSAKRDLVGKIIKKHVLSLIAISYIQGKLEKDGDKVSESEAEKIYLSRQPRRNDAVNINERGYRTHEYQYYGRKGVKKQYGKKDAKNVDMKQRTNTKFKSTSRQYIGKSENTNAENAKRDTHTGMD